MRKLTIALFATLFVVSMATVVLGQGFDGDLRGEVKDPKGLAIANAKVTIRSEGTGEERPTHTSSVGTFEAPHLLVGTYTVTVEIEGFKKYVRKGVEVKQNQVTEVSINMELGAVTTVIEVTASGELVQTTTSNLGTSWDNRAANEIPLPSIGITPDPQNLAILLPGTTTQSGGVVGYGGAIGGNRPRDNNFVLDGVDNNNIGITGADQPAIPDAVGELTILTNQFSAEYGHSTAGQFIMSTKSGTNDVHGNLFWFNNNRAYNSLDSLNTVRPRFDLNRAGGTLGGPIVKDHWFIFGAYQYTTLGQASVPTTAQSVPTAAGITALQNLGSGISQNMLKVITSTLPAAPTQTGTALVTTSTGAQVSIPVGTIAPQAPSFIAEHDFAISSDVQTGKHRFSTRVLYNHVVQPLAGAITVPAFTSSSTTDNRSVTFSDVYAITAHVVNEFRTGYRRNDFNNGVPPLTPPTGLDVFPNFVIAELNLTIGPFGQSPQSGVINTYQWTDNLSISKGAHTLKTGVQMMLWIAPTNFLSRSRGEYDYTNLNSFLQDANPNGTNLALRGIGSGNFAGNQKGFYTFFQDDWKATRKLTLNLGIRYEYTNNPRILSAQAANAISNLPSPILSNARLVSLGLPGNLQPLIFGVPGTDTNNWGPRIGFAYDVFGDHKTAIRGGFAVAYDVLYQNLYTAGAVPPQLQSELTVEAACKFPAPFTPKYCPLNSDGTLSGPFIANGGLPPASPFAGSLDQPTARSLTSAIIHDSVAPKSLTWTLGVQHEFGKDWAVNMTYVGTRGMSLIAQVRLNQRPIAPASAFLPTFFGSNTVPATLPAASSVPGTGTPNLANFLTFGSQKLYEPDGFSSNITAFEPFAQSVYHGASVDVTRRLSGLGRWSHGAFLKASYTYSKEIDNGTNEFFTSIVNPRRAQDGFNLSADRGRGAIDHTHKFALATIYELPHYGGSNGFLKGFTNGWEIAASFIAETGQPVTLLSFLDSNNNGDAAGDRAIFNPNFTVANSISNVNFVCRNGTSGATFIGTSVGSINSNGVASGCGVGQVVPLPNPDGSVVTTSGSKFVYGFVAKNPNAQYITAQKGAVTNVGRNTVNSAGINNWNFTVFKKTYITEQKYVEFRASFVNAFNHAQPTVGGGTIEQLNANSNAPGQGLVQVTDPNNQFLNPANVFSTGNGAAPFERVITFGLKLFF
jgi:hypothetical protein